MSKRVRSHEGGDEDGGDVKPRLPSNLVGATPEISSAALHARGGHRHGGTPGSSSSGTTAAALGEETDPHRLKQRQKQIDYGKNTLGYDRYIQQVPKDKRRRTDIKTPDIHARISTKRFNGLVRAWRRRLHEFDPKPEEAAEGGGVAVATGAYTAPMPAAGPVSYAAVVAAQSPAPRQHPGARRGQGTKDSVEDEDIINTMQGGRCSTGRKGADKKKTRVNPYEDVKTENEEGMDTSEFPSLEEVGVATAGIKAEEVDGGFEIKRSAAAPATVSAQDEELCYSDDDLL